MTFEQRRNRLTTHISEHINIVKRRILYIIGKVCSLFVYLYRCYLRMPLTALAICFTALTLLVENNEIHVFKRPRYQTGQEGSCIISIVET